MTKAHREAEEFLKKFVCSKYPVGIILGTGLGGLVKEIQATHVIDYRDIPNFPVSTVETHHGKLIFGYLSGKNVIAMQGRFHYYEGYDHSRITFPVHIMKSLGVKNLIVSNACGALNPQFRRTDIMTITSHINMHFTSPLINFNFGSINQSNKFYSQRLINISEQTATEEGIELHKGVYLSVQGPNLETRAEYRMVSKMGADVVGMSTIPEVLVAKQLGIESLGLSIVTDECFPNTLKVAVLEDIIEAASIAEPKLTKLTLKLIEKL